MDIKDINIDVADIVAFLTSQLDSTYQLLVIRIDDQNKLRFSSTMNDATNTYYLDLVKFQLQLEALNKGKEKLTQPTEQSFTFDTPDTVN